MYKLKGIWVANKNTVAVCNAVSCTRCKSAKGWPCSTSAGNWSSIAHAARWEAYRAQEADDAGRA